MVVGAAIIDVFKHTPSLKRSGMTRFRSLLAILVCLSLSNCVAVSYTDDNSVRHIIGFVDVALPPEDTGKSPQATAVRIRTLGVNAFANPEANGVILGYGDATFMTVPNNSCVDLVAMGPCTPTSTTPIPAHGARTLAP